MVLDLDEATRRIRLGESLRSIAATVREELLASVGLQPKDTSPETFRAETLRYMAKLCRHLESVCSGDARVGVALTEWVYQSDDYDAYDVLLTSFPCQERTAIVQRGRFRFPGSLTAHW